MKIHKLNLDTETQDKLYELIKCDDFYDPINDLIRDFGETHNWLWQAGFNGKSGGYLVLYQGKKIPSGYKSYCPSCFQRNWTSVSENNGKCGKCGNDRKDYITTHMTIHSFIGRGTDDYEDFLNWEISQLRDRVNLLQSFAKLADSIVTEALYLAREYKVIEEEYAVVKTRPVMLSVAEA